MRPWDACPNSKRWHLDPPCQNRGRSKRNKSTSFWEENRTKEKEFSSGIRMTNCKETFWDVNSPGFGLYITAYVADHSALPQTDLSEFPIHSSNNEIFIFNLVERRDKIWWKPSLVIVTTEDKKTSNKDKSEKRKKEARKRRNQQKKLNEDDLETSTHQSRKKMSVHNRGFVCGGLLGTRRGAKLVCFVVVTSIYHTPCKHHCMFVRETRTLNIHRMKNVKIWILKRFFIFCVFSDWCRPLCFFLFKCWLWKASLQCLVNRIKIDWIYM